MEMKMKTTVADELKIFFAVRRVVDPSEVVSICGWCPDARQKTATLVAEGKTVSHTMCSSCAAKMEAETR
jgi:hypothetical protein